MTPKEVHATFEKWIGSLENTIYEHVADAIDFDLLLVIEQDLAHAIAKMMREQNPRSSARARPENLTRLAAAIVARVICKMPSDPRRTGGRPELADLETCMICAGPAETS